MPDNICTNCKAFNSECTHSTKKINKTTFISMTSTAVTSTETAPDLGLDDKFTFAKSQISAILDLPSYQAPVADKTLLNRTLREIAAYARSLEKALLNVGQSTSSLSRSSFPSHSRSSPPNRLPSENSLPNSNHNPSLTLYPTHAGSPAPSSQIQLCEPNPNEADIADLVKNIEIGASTDSFYGNSSQVALMKTALKIKEEYDDDAGVFTSRTKTPPMSFELERDIMNGEGTHGFDTPNMHIRGKKRAEFWKIYPWQHLPPQLEPTSRLIFPPPDLLASLVETHFQKRSGLMPILHQPTFQRGLDAGLHERDRAFGELVLSVCASGARFSSDERVSEEGANLTAQERSHSIGWKYLNQINPLQELTPQNALYVVQIICNVVMFLSTTSSPSQCWPLISIGIRHVQVVGAHRRHFLGTKPSVKKELWKRAFWSLLCLDVFASAFLGRPRATDRADYDLDLPSECDDEYWEHPDPEQAFKQPPGRPSWVRFWIEELKLLDVLSFALKNLYSVKKPPEVGDSASLSASWDERVVKELDSALNEWVDNVPDHRSLFTQSQSRPQNDHDVIQECHILLSPYAPMQHARLCISDAHNYPSPMGHSPQVIFDSAIMILFEPVGWQTPRDDDGSEEGDEDVYRCLRILGIYEKRYQSAGRMRDILTEIIAAQPMEAQFGFNLGSGSKKREREDQGENRHTTTSVTAHASESDEANAFLFPVRDREDTEMRYPASQSNSALPSFLSPSIPPSSSYPSAQTAAEAEFFDPPMGSTANDQVMLDYNSLFGLPLRTEDLGRLPVPLSNDHVLNWFENNPSPEVDPYWTSGGSSSGITSATSSGHSSLLQAPPVGDGWSEWATYMASVDEFLSSVKHTP
ncbi:fungal-specific transcription factor domain-containing protein [Rhodocollybia butyracea]|uniref:Fungal-specific transcription factor domain-containing protein n=1 Tax=Rhodocollybia butyracea TaxID=206335 RepID=A0A9P5PT87_9AGAR|nr:fungal-specific transcription factor domain-containing protein [Rhodocollybia butyracea]